MNNLGNKERRLVRKHLDTYLDASSVRPELKVNRLRKWANGATYQEIADQEDVTRQSIADTVKPTVEKILEFVQDMG